VTPADGTVLPPVWRVPGWEAIAGLVHGFFGRHGGTSTGPWSSLNVSAVIGDDPHCVERNQARVAAALAGVAIVTMQQVHGDRVVRVDRPDKKAEDADAMLTNVVGIGLGILTADCVPALLVAPMVKVALAVHAGWRGTVAGILPAALAAVQREYEVPAADLRVALGPSIGGCCYEVEATIADQIERQWGPLSHAAWQRAGERGRLDLRHANAEIIARAGIPTQNIVHVGPCTSCNVSDFFSHRRERGHTGRQLSVIGWTGSPRA